MRVREWESARVMDPVTMRLWDFETKESRQRTVDSRQPTVNSRQKDVHSVGCRLTTVGCHSCFRISFSSLLRFSVVFGYVSLSPRSASSMICETIRRALSLSSAGTTNHGA